jgi:acetyl-CoA carboxylase biotin carboxyl carrier protein
MDLKEIQTLIKFISSSKVDEVAIEQKDFKIRIKRNAQTATATVPKPVAIQEVPVPVIQEAAKPVVKEATSPAPEDSKTEEIKSPMIGTFYRKSSPDKPVFVEVGDVIKKGQVICIIEAMLYV